MSDSLRTRPTHPYAQRWREFKGSPEYQRLVNGMVTGRYLENRIDEAFRQGWLAAEREIKDALEWMR